ncbi:CTP synthetase [Thalassobius sp. Cn5-15]|uniref:CTP synthetase n=1 Tax=Thalassobius sp. Cn5-15 TaxID=2917763 RepID=UPI001EF2C698|nr:CTP synthetase [Thalassobius sp. Cn5-15]MCG7493353.1 CTP synthetase [Thalassobius sp. Cn5-15]
MFRLAAILHLFIGTTLAGSALIVALVTGHDTVGGLIVAALVGFVVSLPVTYFVARALFTD